MPPEVVEVLGVVQEIRARGIHDRDPQAKKMVNELYTELLKGLPGVRNQAEKADELYLQIERRFFEMANVVSAHKALGGGDKVSRAANNTGERRRICFFFLDGKNCAADAPCRDRFDHSEAGRRQAKADEHVMKQASRWPGPLGRRPGRAHQNSGSWDTGAQCFCFAGTRIPVTWDSRPLNWDAYPSCGTQLGRHLHAHWDHKPINWDATGTQLGR